jgi:hypothetical protein
MINTDRSPSLRDLKDVDIDYRVIGGDQAVIDRWLPWVHKFISNAKSWIVGTHHGVESNYLGQYLAEYTFNPHCMTQLKIISNTAVDYLKCNSI